MWRLFNQLLFFRWIHWKSPIHVAYNLLLDILLPILSHSLQIRRRATLLPLTSTTCSSLKSIHAMFNCNYVFFSLLRYTSAVRTTVRLRVFWDHELETSSLGASFHKGRLAQNPFKDQTQTNLNTVAGKALRCFKSRGASSIPTTLDFFSIYRAL